VAVWSILRPFWELRGKSYPVRPDTASGQLLKQYLAYVILRARSLQVNEFNVTARACVDLVSFRFLGLPVLIPATF
jgi:hypothetical protein